MPARRACRIERSRKDFASHISNAQFERFRNQLLKNHRTMTKRLGAAEIFFADAVRVDEGLTGIHADLNRTKELRDGLAFSLREEPSSRGGIVGNERTRHAQTSARGEPKLSLLVLGVAFAGKVVYP